MLFPFLAVVMMAGFLFIHFSPEVASAQTIPLEGQSGIIEKSLPHPPYICANYRIEEFVGP